MTRSRPKVVSVTSEKLKSFRVAYCFHAKTSIPATPFMGKCLQIHFHAGQSRFTWILLLEDYFWNRGERQLQNSLFNYWTNYQFIWCRIISLASWSTITVNCLWIETERFSLTRLKTILSPHFKITWWTVVFFACGCLGIQMLTKYKFDKFR